MGVLLAGLQVGRPAGVLTHRGVIAVVALWPLSTQLPLAMQALNTKNHI